MKKAKIEKNRKLSEDVWHVKEQAQIEHEMRSMVREDDIRREEEFKGKMW